MVRAASREATILRFVRDEKSIPPLAA